MVAVAIVVVLAPGTVASAAVTHSWAEQSGCGAVVEAQTWARLVACFDAPGARRIVLRADMTDRPR